MICYKLIPRGEKFCVEKDSIKIREILNSLSELSDTGLVVVVNGKIINDPDYTVTNNDEIVVVQEFLGG